ncbi:MAG: hypothetical protein QOE06_518 [Thermoleophilaceae bacterium]|jgi:hypothetical protein|nr:hypothetical protein [Thermoleophilaceae bacterium]
MRLFPADHTQLLAPALIVMLALATVYVQYRGLLDDSAGRDPRRFIEVDLVGRHDAILDHTAGDPWRYRLLSEWGAEGLRRAARAAGFSQPAVVGFLGFRILQNLAIFGLMWVFLRRLGFGLYERAFGLGLLAWGFTQALFHQAMSFNTYGDLVFYLAAALLILNRRWWWILPLSIAAAVNRETSGLIPVMLMAMAWPLGWRSEEGRRALKIGAISLVAFAATYGILRAAVGPAFFIVPNGQDPGSELFSYNLGRGMTWDFVFQTVNILPLLALAAWRRWSPELRAIGVAIVPAWIAIHLFTSVLAESRLLLVPLALAFIPGALAGLRTARPAEGAT